MKKTIILAFFLISSLLISLSHAFANSSEQLIIINKTNNQLAFFDGGQLIRTFSVGTGRSDSLTPEGTFKIVNKIKNRPYYTDNIPGGDPTNPLGDRWLGINPLGTNGNVYAIHGNNNPNSIGKYVSAGCVRMHNDEIRWLYEQVKVNTPVIILHSDKSFVEVANQFGYYLKANYKVIINGQSQSFDQDPILLNNRVLVPLRSIFESLGATVSWDPESSTITATKNNKLVQLTIGSSIAVVNGKEISIDVPAQSINSRTVVPIRFVSEALGATINVDNQKKEIHISLDTTTTPKPKPKPMDVYIDNQKQTYSENPYVVNGTTMVPLRGIFESLGAYVMWDQSTKTITATKDNSTISLQIDSNEATIDETITQIDVPPHVTNGTTFVPIRFVSESLGARVFWDQESNRINIFSN